MKMQKVMNPSAIPIKLDGILKKPIRPGATVLVPAAFCKPLNEFLACKVLQMAPQLRILEEVPESSSEYADEYEPDVGGPPATALDAGPVSGPKLDAALDAEIGPVQLEELTAEAPRARRAKRPKPEPTFE